MSRDASELAHVEPMPTASTAWKRAGPAAGAAVVALLLIFWPTTVFTVQFWETNGAYSHGYLVVPISLYMIWLSRGTLSAITPRVQPWGCLVLLGLGIVWALAFVVDVALAMQLALLAAIAAMLWTLLGSEAFRVLAFPVGYLLLAVPVWSHLVPVLQDYTAIASTRALRAVGVPVFLETHYISIPGGQFVVERVCAGLRYLLATLSIAALFAWLNYRRVSTGVLFVVTAAAISIVMNWVRVIVIILAGHLGSMQHFLVTDHIAFGWGVFVVALIPIFFTAVWLQRFDRRPARARAASTEIDPRRAKNGNRTIAVTVPALLAVAIGPMAIVWAASPPALDADLRLQAPPAIAPWSLAGDSRDGRWRPSYRGADAETLASYVDGGAHVSLYIAYYASQRADAELVSEVNTLYEAGRWHPRRDVIRQVNLGNGEALNVRELELVSDNGDERLVWYWYRIGDGRAVAPVTAKLVQLWSSLRGMRQSAVIAASPRHGESIEAARQHLERFLRSMAPRAEAAVDEVETTGRS